MSYRNSKRQRRERGAILIFTVLLLGSIVAIALTLTGIFLPKIRAAVNAGSGSIGAIYAADSAIEWCIYTNRGNPALPAPIMTNGSSYTLTPPDCTGAASSRAIGTYQGATRSLELSF